MLFCGGRRGGFLYWNKNSAVLSLSFCSRWERSFKYWKSPPCPRIGQWISRPAALPPSIFRRRLCLLSLQLYQPLGEERWKSGEGQQRSANGVRMLSGIRTEGKHPISGRTCMNRRTIWQDFVNLLLCPTKNKDKNMSTLKYEMVFTRLDNSAPLRPRGWLWKEPLCFSSK